MLTTTKRAKIINAINNAFDKIGHSNGHTMPTTQSNRDPIAWEFFVAQYLTKLAEVRKDKAQRACVASGVLFDHKVSPRPVGTHIVFEGELLTYVRIVKNPSSRVDVPRLKSALMKQGVKEDIIDKAISASKTLQAAPHTFAGSLSATK